MSRRLVYLLAAAAAVAVAAGGVLVAGRTDPTELVDEAGERTPEGGIDPASLEVLFDGRPAPVIELDTWLNGDPVSSADLEGKVVLYDFWTYSCVNCIRTFPHLRAWHERYSDDGLVIIGIHAPEFAFEQDPDNVQDALERNDVTWPVVIDNEHAMFRAFELGGAVWPFKAVFDRDNVARYAHVGEGGYAETEDVIRALLGVDAAAPRAGEEPVEPVFDAAVSPEIYLGTTLGQEFFDPTHPAGMTPGGAEEFDWPDGETQVSRFYLKGSWLPGLESVLTLSSEAQLLLDYSAAEVNLVMTPPVNEAVRVLVLLDGAAVPAEVRGDDIAVDADGVTFVEVDRSDMYRLVDAAALERHQLLLLPQGAGLQAYAFTFGAVGAVPAAPEGP